MLTCLNCIGQEVRTRCFGPCPCKIDQRDIVAHVEAGYCPDGQFGSKAKPEDWDTHPEVVPGLPPQDSDVERGPGNVLKAILLKAGYRQSEAGLVCPNGTIVRNCGCEAMRIQMNRWGYRGCVKRRKEIAEWFTSKAKECGLEVRAGSVMGLLRAGLIEWLKTANK